MRTKLQSLRAWAVQAFEQRADLISRTMLFIPGMSFLLLGAIVVIAPTLVLAVLAAVFVFLGVFLCLMAWKFMQLRAKLQQFSEDLQGQIIVHGVTLQRGPFGEEGFEDNAPEEDALDTKKIVYH